MDKDDNAPKNQELLGGKPSAPLYNNEGEIQRAQTVEIDRGFDHKPEGKNWIDHHLKREQEHRQKAESLKQQKTTQSPNDTRSNLQTIIQEKENQTPKPQKSMQDQVIDRRLAANPTASPDQQQQIKNAKLSPVVEEKNNELKQIQKAAESQKMDTQQAKTKDQPGKTIASEKTISKTDDHQEPPTPPRKR